MSERADYSETYELRQVILFGAAGSLGVIFSFLLILYVGSQVSSHHQPFANTVDEMMDYAEFFAFVFVSFFSSALLTRSLRGRLGMKAPSWLLISLLGSVLFSFSFSTWTWLEEVASYRAGNPFRAAPAAYFDVLAAAGFFSLVLTFVTATASAFVSQFPSLTGVESGKGLGLDRSSPGE